MVSQSGETMVQGTLSLALALGWGKRCALVPPSRDVRTWLERS